MQPIRLSPDEVAYIIAKMRAALYEVLVAVDPADQSFKIKIDGGTWSPPAGKPA